MLFTKMPSLIWKSFVGIKIESILEKESDDGDDELIYNQFSKIPFGAARI